MSTAGKIQTSLSLEVSLFLKKSYKYNQTKCLFYPLRLRTKIKSVRCLLFNLPVAVVIFFSSIRIYLLSCCRDSLIQTTNQADCHNPTFLFTSYVFSPLVLLVSRSWMAGGTASAFIFLFFFIYLFVFIPDAP